MFILIFSHIHGTHKISGTVYFERGDRIFLLINDSFMILSDRIFSATGLYIVKI